MITVPLPKVARGDWLREPRQQEVLLTATVHQQRTSAAVSMGNEHVGETPLYLRRPPGLYTLTLRVPGKPPVNVEVAVTKERGAHIEVPLGIDPLR